MSIKHAARLFGVVVFLPSVASHAFAKRTGPTEFLQIPAPFLQPCSPEYQRLLKWQFGAFDRLQGLAQREAETLCAAIETADQLGAHKLIDPKLLQQLLTPKQRELESLGIDPSKVNLERLFRLLCVDLPKIELRDVGRQCRQSQAALDRIAARELSRVEKEIIRCDDRV